VMGEHFNSRVALEVIGAFLLIVITITAAVLVYAFAVGLSDNLASSDDRQNMEDIIVEAYNFPVNAPLTISFRNIGSAAVDMSQAEYFLNGMAGSPGVGCKLTLVTDRSCTTTLTVTTSNFVSNSVYTLKVFPPENGVLVYPVVYGGTG